MVYRKVLILQYLVSLQSFQNCKLSFAHDVYTLYTTPQVSIIREHGLDFRMYADGTRIYIYINKSGINNQKHNLESFVDSMDSWK